MNQFHAKVVDFIAATSAMGDKAQTILREKTASDAAVAEKLNTAIEALVANGKIDATEKAACADYLKDHSQAIRFIEKMAAHRTVEEVGRLGSPGGQTKTATVGSLSSPFAGVRGEGLKDSDLALITGLGLDPALFGG